jgi:hypothetical protein
MVEADVVNSIRLHGFGHNSGGQAAGRHIPARELAPLEALVKPQPISKTAGITGFTPLLHPPIQQFVEGLPPRISHRR